MEFWQSCEFFLYNCSNVSAGNPKNDLKKKISTTLFVQIFFCFSWLFLWHPHYFLSIDEKNCSNSRTDERTKLFFCKKYFFSENVSGRADCSCDNPGKNFFPTKRFLDQSPKKCERLYIFQKLFFPQKLPRIHRLRVSQLWQKFSLEVNNRTESEKRSNFSLLKKIFHKLFPRTSIAVLPSLKNFSAIVPKTSKIFRKSPSFQDFHSKNLLCKCSTGHVESILDNPAKNFTAKTQVFLVKIQKRRKTNCSTVLFDVFSSVHLDYCFNTPD